MPNLTVVVVEKGSEVGAHILSGAVIDPVSLDKLIPDWREDADCPLKTPGQGRPVLLDDRG
jgi:electron-transferring-flavoprotein dehydrogenase